MRPTNPDKTSEIFQKRLGKLGNWTYDEMYSKVAFKTLAFKHFHAKITISEVI
jgi:hypothetical protein